MDSVRYDDPMNWTLITIIFISVLAATAVLWRFRHDLYRWAFAREAARAGLQECKTQLGDMTLSYYDNKNTEAKHTLVLLHGFTANKELWVRFVQKLRGSYRVLAVDLGGHGNSDQDFSLRYDLDDQVRWLVALLDQLKIDRVVMAGNSMGGAISALFAATHPDRAAGIILLDPAGEEEHQSELYHRAMAGKNTLLVESRADFNEVNRFTMSKRPFIPFPIKQAAAERYIANLPMNKKVWHDFREGEHEYDLHQALSHITCPALLIWGEEDRVLHPDNCQGFARQIPHLEVVKLPKTGHMAMIERPEMTARLVEKFLEGVKECVSQY